MSFLSKAILFVHVLTGCHMVIEKPNPPWELRLVEDEVAIMVGDLQRGQLITWRDQSCEEDDTKIVFDSHSFCLRPWMPNWIDDTISTLKKTEYIVCGYNTCAIVERGP